MSKKGEHARLRAVANALATSPGLGAFTVAVALLGLPGAVELCATREPPPRLSALWDGLGYSIAQLPADDDIRCLLFGIEAARRHAVARATKKDPTPLFVMADELGCSPTDIHKGQRLLESYGGSATAPRLESGRALGAL